ncbi:MAG TPA: SDR family oxidoreductase [Gemmatimonadaceae bacterium]|nr:SDR family oxidoreductase [Gemmatimonadaceae bacterium]
MAKEPLSGRVVLITGIGREGQVGEAVAAALADAGAVIAAVDVLKDAAEARAAALRERGARANAFACDLTDEGAVQTLAATIASTYDKRLDALVHLAGGFGMANVADSTLAVWQKQLALNLTTAALTARAFLPLVRAARGAFVFFGSAAALPGASVANMAAYATAKSGVLTLTRALAEEERANGVRANALAPTSIRTAANEKSMGRDARYVEREDVARMVVWLCSDESIPLTGQVLALG